MGLLGNYSVYHKLPEKFLTGTTLYGDRANWNKPGMMRSMGVGSGNDWGLVAIPNGLGMDGAWLLPQTAGKMVSRYVGRLTLSASGTGALGRNVIGSGFITIDGVGTGGLIAGAVGSATFYINAEGAIRAVVGGVGSATITITGEANTGATGWLVGSGLMTVDATMDTYAIGWMVGTTEEAGLSTTGIANAVWNAVATDSNDPGSMGEKLNDAGSASNPWTETLPGSYSEGTAGKIIGTATYMAKVWPLNPTGPDDYLMTWFKRGVPITSGITLATIRVIKAADGTDLVPQDYATEVGSLGVFKYSTATKMVQDTQYIIVLGAIIDGEARSWYQPYGIE